MNCCGCSVFLFHAIVPLIFSVRRQHEPFSFQFGLRSILLPRRLFQGPIVTVESRAALDQSFCRLKEFHSVPYLSGNTAGSFKLDSIGQKPYVFAETGTWIQQSSFGVTGSSLRARLLRQGAFLYSSPGTEGSAILPRQVCSAFQSMVERKDGESEF